MRKGVKKLFVNSKYRLTRKRGTFCLVNLITDKPYKVYTEDFLSNKDNGDFDTEGFFYVETPDGEKIEINKFYHYPARGEKIEITREKYEAMKANRADKPIAED